MRSTSTASNRGEVLLHQVSETEFTLDVFEESVCSSTSQSALKDADVSSDPVEMLGSQPSYEANKSVYTRL